MKSSSSRHVITRVCYGLELYGDCGLRTSRAATSDFGLLRAYVPCRDYKSACRFFHGVPPAVAFALADAGSSRKRVPRCSHGETAMASRSISSYSRSTNGSYRAWSSPAIRVGTLPWPSTRELRFFTARVDAEAASAASGGTPAWTSTSRITVPGPAW